MNRKAQLSGLLLGSATFKLGTSDCELNFPRKIHPYQFEQQKQEVANWLHSIQVARWIWQLTLKWWLRHSPKAKVFGLLFWEIFGPTLKQNIRWGQQHQWQYSTPSSQQRPNWKTFELMVLTRSPTKTKNNIENMLVGDALTHACIWSFLKAHLYKNKPRKTWQKNWTSWRPQRHQIINISNPRSACPIPSLTQSKCLQLLAPLEVLVLLQGWTANLLNL